MLLGEVLRRSLTMEFGGRLIRQHERLYLARTSQPRRGLSDVAQMHAADGIAAWRWWTLAELESTTEVIWPAELARRDRTCCADRTGQADRPSSAALRYGARAGTSAARASGETT